jgi:hypothetical protein
MSASCAADFASSAPLWNGSRRPPNGAVPHASAPSNASTDVSPWMVTSRRDSPGRLCSIAMSISVPPPARPLPVMRSDWIARIRSIPPCAATKRPTISSTFAAFSGSIAGAAAAAGAGAADGVAGGCGGGCAGG